MESFWSDSILWLNVFVILSVDIITVATQVNKVCKSINLKIATLFITNGWMYWSSTVPYKSTNEDLINTFSRIFLVVSFLCDS